MKTCKYCGKPIEWDRNASGKLVPYDPDGTPHHATCRAWHKVRAEKARQTRELKAAYGLAAAPIQDIPGQLKFDF